jgi:hypothetical protein
MKYKKPKISFVGNHTRLEYENMVIYLNNDENEASYFAWKA